jgi:DNA-binding SARP family transcriptional activator
MTVADTSPAPQKKEGVNRLVVYTLGCFQVYRNDEVVENWSSRKGAMIFKYLLLNRDTPIGKEMLMEQFWPDADEESQRNNLNVAVYSLRQALRNGDPTYSYVLFQNDCYLLNPDLDMWVDYEAFLACYKTGKRQQQLGNLSEALSHYKAAESLYQGDFLPDAPYEDWISPLRQTLQGAYISLLDFLSLHYLEQKDYPACITICNKMLAIDPSFEEAHCRLMRCYSRQGMAHLAQRQYDRCVRALEELEVPLMPETEALFARICAGERV